MKLIVAWPDWRTRQDRCIMFSRIAEWVNEVYLITSTALPDYLQNQIHPNCRIVYDKSSTRGLAFARAAGRIAKRIAQDGAKHNERIIFQQLAVTRLAPQAIVGRWLPRHLFRSVLSMYSPTPTLFRTRGWRAESSTRLPWKQELAHLRANLQKQALEFVSCQFADVVTGNSEEIRQDVIRYYHKRPINVFTVPAEVDTEFFCPSNFHNSNPDVPTLLFCGRVYARKGVFDLIEAARILKESGLSFRLKVLGDNEIEAQQIEAAIEATGIRDFIQLIPRQPREVVRDSMQEATILVHPSYYEGSPRVVKEAMSCGCPVVTYDIPGTRMLDPSGRALVLVPRGNVAALTESIKGLLTNQQERLDLASRGRQQMLKVFDTKNVAKIMSELYGALF